MNYDKYIKYYGKTDICKKLYKWSQEGTKINNLMKLVSDDTNILLAIKLISGSNGKNTKGIDNITYEDISNLDIHVVINEVKKLLNYKASENTRSTYIYKNKRRIEISSIYSRIAQQSIMNILVPIVEAKFSDLSFAYRPKRTTKHAFARICNSLWNSKIDRYIMEIDLSNYFTTIPLDKCVDKLRNEFNIQDPKFLEVIKRLLWTNNIDKNGNLIEYNGIGLPQGNILSPILSNVYLHSLDKKLEDMDTKSKDVSRHYKKGLTHYNNWIDKTGKPSFKFVRYADDIRIVCNTKHEASMIFQEVANYCSKWNLTINTDKTKIYSTADYPFIEMVGFKARRSKEGFLISPINEKNIKNMIREKRREVKKTGNIMQLYNLFYKYISYYDICTNNASMICGFNKILYSMYYKNDNRFFKVEKEKSKDIYYIKYKNVENKRETLISLWTFNKDVSRSIKYYNMDNCWNPLIDNEKINLDFNWLLEKSMKETGYKQTRLFTYLPGLYNQQKGFDPITNKQLNESCCIHHKQPLHKGGTDSFANLCLVNYDTHNAIHNEKYEEHINIVNKRLFNKLSLQAR